MTLIVTIAVRQGLVLAADSVRIETIDGERRVSPTANKIVQMGTWLPVGAVFWGGLAIGERLVVHHLRDLGRRLENSSDPWFTEQSSIDVFVVAQRVREFVQELHRQANREGAIRHAFGCIVGGYSAGKDVPERLFFESDPNGVFGEVGPVTTNLSWQGQKNAMWRLAPSDDWAPDAMPLVDAVDLADYLMNTGIGYSRFETSPANATTVLGPVELATITRHEGFRWVRHQEFG